MSLFSNISSSRITRLHVLVFTLSFPCSRSKRTLTFLPIVPKHNTEKRLDSGHQCNSFVRIRSETQWMKHSRQQTWSSCLQFGSLFKMHQSNTSTTSKLVQAHSLLKHSPNGQSRLFAIFSNTYWTIKLFKIFVGTNTWQLDGWASAFFAQNSRF